MITLHYLKRFTSLCIVTALLTWSVPFASSAFQSADRISVLIAFSTPPEASDRALIARYGGTITQSYTLVPALAIEVPERALSGLARNPRVSTIEPNGVFTLIAPSISNDQAYVDELTSTWGVRHIGSGEAHALGHFGTNVKVAVIDTGIDYNHPELAGVYVGGVNFLTGSLNAMDDNNHGTHVAGTIAATRNGVGVVGVTPDIALYGLKVFGANGSASYSDIIAALEWSVANGIAVANHSYGSNQDPGTIVRQAYDNSAAAGVLHIAAAGNTGLNSGRGDTVNFPARYGSVVAVAATDKNNARANFSSTGPTVAIAAPGVGIPSTITSGRFASFSGTSMASPHVAGAAALIRGLDPTLSPYQVMDILTSTAKNLRNKNQYGAGLVDIPAILENLQYVPEPPVVDEPPIGDEQPVDPDPINIVTAAIGTIEYTTSGGRLNDRHLSVNVPLLSSNGAVSGASIDAHIYSNNSLYGTFSGTTNTTGNISASFSNAPSGTYRIEIVSIDTPIGYQWDDNTPLNSFTKI